MQGHHLIEKNIKMTSWHDHNTSDARVVFDQQSRRDAGFERLIIR